MANNTVVKAPIAADSVGVAMPAIITPTTTAKIDTKGSTYFTKGWNMSQHLCAVNSVFGAKCGWILTRMTM